LHFIDISKKDIIKEYNIIRKELSKYGKGLDKKNEIIVLTKKDLVNEKIHLKKIEKLKNYTEKNYYAISIKDKKSIEKLIYNLIFKNKSKRKNKENKWSP